MNPISRFIFGAVLLGTADATSVHAPEASAGNQGPVYVTTFFEVTPGAITDTAAHLTAYRYTVSKESGILSVHVYQEVGWRSRFVTLDVWTDWASYNEHAKGAARGEFFQKLSRSQFGPPDVRTHLMYFGAPDAGPPHRGSVIVIGHLDVLPSNLPKLLEIMQTLSEGTATDSGLQKFQIIRQAPGTGNHFRLLEIWASQHDWEAHNMAAHTKDFRAELAPMLGTPYDQRHYRVLD